MHRGYHQNCQECREFNVNEVDRLIFDIKMQMKKPNSKPQTSMQVRSRADNLRSMATNVKLNGGEVNKDYA